MRYIIHEHTLPASACWLISLWCHFRHFESLQFAFMGLSFSSPRVSIFRHLHVLIFFNFSNNQLGLPSIPFSTVCYGYYQQVCHCSQILIYCEDTVKTIPSVCKSWSSCQWELKCASRWILVSVYKNVPSQNMQNLQIMGHHHLPEAPGAGDSLLEITFTPVVFKQLKCVYCVW